MILEQQVKEITEKHISLSVLGVDISGTLEHF